MIGMTVTDDDDLYHRRIEAELLKSAQKLRFRLVGRKSIDHQQTGGISSLGSPASSDTTCLRSLVKGAWRTIDAVFKRSGVVRARPTAFAIRLRQNS
jgi:hypothetical protein